MASYQAAFPEAEQSLAEAKTSLLSVTVAADLKAEQFDEKQFSPRYRFAEWPNLDVPVLAAGVYAIWDGDTPICCGMSGRELEKAQSGQRKKYGLITRLNSHASGRLSGDQFCVYVANRLVIPALQSEQLSKFASGELTLDRLTKTHIHSRLDYQFVIVSSSRQAYELEMEARDGSLFGSKPLLNPA
jgi:hypothetical protein